MTQSGQIKTANNLPLSNPNSNYNINLLIIKDKNYQNMLQWQEKAELAKKCQNNPAQIILAQNMKK